MYLTGWSTTWLFSFRHQFILQKFSSVVAELGSFTETRCVDLMVSEGGASSTRAGPPARAVADTMLILCPLFAVITLIPTSLYIEIYPPPPKCLMAACALSPGHASVQGLSVGLKRVCRPQPYRPELVTALLMDGFNLRHEERQRTLTLQLFFLQVLQTHMTGEREKSWSVFFIAFFFFFCTLPLE